MLVGETYRDSVSVLFHSLRPVAALAPLVILVPPTLLTRLLAPLQPRQARQAAREQRDLIYLNQRMSAVVKCVDHMPPELWNVRRLLTELGDARDALWSWTPHPLTY